ncbi:hypothetical protein [Amycolatopsis sp. NPDC051128]|uniref:hypothetical protein n=1 Tax=Amycolatopsis sp. NPDC051128 TaxID=3155412 RepID=UPI003436460E
MATPRQAAEANVHVSYHQLQIVERDVIDDGDALSWRSNGLVDVHRTGLATVACGTHTGYVSVRVELYDDEPSVSVSEWDDVVEVSLAAPRGQLRIVGLMSDVSDELPMISHRGPGEYRLRIHARDRDKAAYPTVGDELSRPAELLLVQCWPQGEAPQRVHKTTDRYGAELRKLAD